MNRAISTWGVKTQKNIYLSHTEACHEVFRCHQLAIQTNMWPVQQPRPISFPFSTDQDKAMARAIKMGKIFSEKEGCSDSHNVAMHNFIVILIHF